MRKEPKALIIRKQAWGDYCLLRLKADAIAHESQPGQFLMVRPNELSQPLLRRPFSLHSAGKGCVEIFFLKSGVGTTLLSQKQEGETLDILGPLGKGFCLKRDSRNTAMALIGGGRGIAPLYFLAQRLQDLGADIRIYYGGRTWADLPLLEKFQQENFDALFSTDDGSFGFKGLVTNLFTRELKHNSFARIYGCGPEAMMRKTAQIAQDNSISAEFSLESLMGCGFGACWGCVRRIKTENREEWVKICEEGPVFSGNQIIWEDEAS